MTPIQTVLANGLRFATLQEGTGPLVLMLHGFPDTAHTWDLARPVIAQAGFRVVAPFLRGYHPTEIPADGAYDADTLGRDAIALAEVLSPEPAILVGHDWGASAALSAATVAPERFSKLVTVAIPHPAGVLPTPRVLWAARHFLALRRAGAEARVRQNDFAEIDALVRRWSPAWDVPANETAAVKRAFAEPGCLNAALGYYRALKLFPPQSPQSQRARVTVPSVVFAGLHDQFPADVYERTRSRHTGPFEIVRVPGGHFLHREHPEVFVRELLRVIRGRS